MNIKYLGVLSSFLAAGILNACGSSDDSDLVVTPRGLPVSQTSANPPSASASDASASDTSAASIIPEEAAMEKLINDYRSTNGLSPYLFDERVRKVARTHSKNMGEETVAFGHTGFTERLAEVRVLMPVSGGVENVGMCYNTDPVSTIFVGWQKSPGHNANMLHNYSGARAGIGYVVNSKQYNYFTLLVVDTNQ